MGIRKAQALSARCLTSESDVESVAEVPFATPAMQAVQDPWLGLVTRRAVGVWFLVLGRFGETILITR